MFYRNNKTWYLQERINMFLRGASVEMCIIILIQNEEMNALLKELVGRGSSLQNTVKQVVGSLSITILTIFLQHRQNLHYYRLAEQFNSISLISSNFLNSAKEYILGKGFNSINPQTGGVVSCLFIFRKRSLFVWNR